MARNNQGAVSLVRIRQEHSCPSCSGRGNESAEGVQGHPSAGSWVGVSPQASRPTPSPWIELRSLLEPVR